MIVKVPEVIKGAARELRKNQTNAEKVLWDKIRNDKLGVRFLRQKPVYVYTEDYGLDRFVIPDFYCNDKNLIIEVDGSIHNLKEALELDIEKEKLLNNLGIKIIRVTNEEVFNNIELVITKIKKEIQK